jgi:hypothetical protein
MHPATSFASPYTLVLTLELRQLTTTVPHGPLYICIVPTHLIMAILTSLLTPHKPSAHINNGNRPHQPPNPLLLLTPRQNCNSTRERRRVSRSSQTRLRRRARGARKRVFPGLSESAEPGGV